MILSPVDLTMLKKSMMNAKHGLTYMATVCTSSPGATSRKGCLAFLTWGKKHFVDILT